MLQLSFHGQLGPRLNGTCGSSSGWNHHLEVSSNLCGKDACSGTIPAFGRMGYSSFEQHGLLMQPLYLHQVLVFGERCGSRPIRLQRNRQIRIHLLRYPSLLLRPFPLILLLLQAYPQPLVIGRLSPPSFQKLVSQHHEANP